MGSSGFDTFSQIDFFYNTTQKYNPDLYKTHYSLGFSLTLDHLFTNLTGNVSLVPGKFIHKSDGPLVLPSGANLDLQNVKINVLMEIPLYETIIKNMNIGNFVNNLIFCIMDMIDVEDIQMRVM